MHELQVGGDSVIGVEAAQGHGPEFRLAKGHEHYVGKIIYIGTRVVTMGTAGPDREHTAGLQDGPGHLAAVSQELGHPQLAQTHDVLGICLGMQKLIRGQGNYLAGLFQAFGKACLPGEEVRAPVQGNHLCAGIHRTWLREWAVWGCRTGKRYQSVAKPAQDNLSGLGFTQLKQDIRHPEMPKGFQ
jgi:hypothetical protein